MNMPRMDWTISAGHILTAFSMMGSAGVVIVLMAFAWADLRSDVSNNTRRIGDAESRIENIPERLAGIEATTRAILDRMDRAERHSTPGR